MNSIPNYFTIEIRGGGFLRIFGSYSTITGYLARFALVVVNLVVSPATEVQTPHELQVPPPIILAHPFGTKVPAAHPTVVASTRKYLRR